MRLIWKFFCHSVKQQTHTVRQNYNNILIVKSYMFAASLAQHQGVQSCIKRA